MYLKSLYLRNFRNFKEEYIPFDPRINLICGDNAQGKTNLLEAISFLSTGRSFRTQHLHELIYEKEPFFYLEAEIVSNQVPSSIKLSFDRVNKQLQLGGKRYTTFQPLLGLVPLILQTPQDMELVMGSPNIRRRFLNLHLAQSDPQYVEHLIRYWRAMKQRNCLLRLKKGSIECWEEEMALSASYLNEMRTRFIRELKEPLDTIGYALSGEKEHHEIRYTPSFADEYLAQLAKHRAKEQELGFTIIGPHRDELSFWVQTKPLKIFGSEGQKKTMLGALRLAEWERLAIAMQTSPIMAIDELGLALDHFRQELIWQRLQSLGQVFITTARNETLSYPALFIKEGRFFPNKPSPAKMDLSSAER